MLLVIYFLALLGTGNTVQWCPNITELSEYSGTFKSPLHDSFYPADTTCSWRLIAPSTLHIKVTFRSFNLEACAQCSCDSLTVYDITEGNTRVKIGKFCGSKKPLALYSTGRYMKVVFRSDHGDSKSGFLADYSAVQRGSVCRAEPYVITNGGTITTPEFTSSYPRNSKCIWLIQAKPNARIRYKFLFFEIEKCSLGAGRCQCDYVEVRDGNSSSSFLIGRYCGDSAPPEMYSTGRYLWVKFKSDYQVNKKGFVAEFSTEKLDQYSCPANWRYPFHCPKNNWSQHNNSTNVCCYDNGPNCCESGGTQCADSGKTQRSYCPRPQDKKTLTRCCTVKDKPSCCLSEGNHLRIHRLVVFAVLLSGLTSVLL